MFYMVFGFPFFEADNASEILRQNRKYTNAFDGMCVIKQELKDSSSKISKDALNLLLLLLEQDPKKRISAADALNHPYFIPVPTGMTKISGTNDLVSDPLSKSTPTMSPIKPIGNGKQLITEDNRARRQSVKVNPNQTADRFANKDSFYLDMGKPELNGKIDTITTGSSNENSVLLQKQNSNASVGSNGPDSPSSFSSKNKGVVKRSRSLKPGVSVAGGANQSFLKAAIFRNMQKNNSEMTEEIKDGGLLTLERRRSDNQQGERSPFSGLSPLSSARSGSPDRDSDSESNDEGSTPTGKSGKALASSKRRFQPFAKKNAQAK